tara:strand:+ start:633 stop:953 length:321 start_codon:yes stop_codon:yes gene_type:complete
MINKKKIIVLLIFCLLGACTSPTTMLGPAYTLSTSGNVFQTSLSYGSNELVKTYTGKTTFENLKDIGSKKIKDEKNIQMETLKSEEFYILVKNRIDKTSGILKLSH